VTAESKPRLLRRWSRRATAWAAGAAALVAGGSAAAVVATSGGTPHPRPSQSTSNAAQATKDALDSILGSNPDLGQPVSKLISQGKLPKATYAGDSGSVGVPAGVSRPRSATGTATGFVPGPSSGDFTLLQMASLALSEGCPASQAPIAGAIGAAESGGNSGAQGDVSLMDATWDWSEGLWQIRGLRSERGTGGLRDSLANADPAKDAKAMMAISSGCTDWTPWSTYNSGAYLAYLPSMQAAVAAATQYRLKTGSYPPVAAGGDGTVPSPQPLTSTPAIVRRSGKPTAKASPAAPSRTASSSARTSSSAPTKSAARSSSARPSAHPSATPSKSKSKLPTLPVKLPTLPIKTPTLPVHLPTSITLPPLPTLPGLP
jgi:Lysozyme like domain